MKAATQLKQILIGSRLRNRFILFFIILASAPLLILGWVALYLIEISHRQDVSNLELALIDQKNEEVEKFFRDISGVLQLQVGFTQKSEIRLTDQHFLLQGLLYSNRAFEEVSFIGLDGMETAYLASDGNSRDLADFALLPSFAEARSGKIFTSSIHHTLAGPLVVISAPVQNRNGEIIQVLSAHVNLTTLVRSVEAARLGTSGYLILTDNEGVIIGSGGGAKISPNLDIASLVRVQKILAGQILDALDPLDRYKSAFSGTPVVSAGKKITKLGWISLAEWPIADADSIIRDIRDRIVELTVFSILTVLLTAPLFAARLVKPIRRLEEASQDIAQGKFENQVEIKTRDELEELGNAFNTMAQGLKRLQDLKNEFVFIAAHELRTPVTAIKGYLSMVREGSAGTLTDTMKKYLDPVWTSNERLIRLVDDILEIARSDAGRVRIEVVPLDLGEIVNAVLVEIKPLADAKHIKVTYEELPSLPAILGDLDRIKEILMNFISNSIKYNNEGGWVKIYHEREKSFLLTSVADNGFGIPEHEQKHLFEKFFRSEVGRMKAIEGTGLGLFITKELVEKMKGKIWFHSKESQGSRFTFGLPYAEKTG